MRILHQWPNILCEVFRVRNFGACGQDHLNFTLLERKDSILEVAHFPTPLLFLVDITDLLRPED